jgi:hypothetical protein
LNVLRQFGGELAEEYLLGFVGGERLDHGAIISRRDTIFKTPLLFWNSNPTVWLSGGRWDGTRGAEQLNYRAACPRAAQAARPLV